MRKLTSKFLAVLSSFSIFVQVLQPVIVYAQELPSPSPEATPVSSEEPTPPLSTEPTVAPEQRASPSPTDTVTPSPEVSASPTPTETPVESATPSPSDEATLPPTPSPADAPSSEPTSTENSNSDQNQPSNPETSPSSPTPTVTATPVVEEETPQIGHLDAVILEGTTQDVLSTLSELSLTSEMSATLVTDKPDYAPTEVVVISGSGFVSNEEYTLYISSTDPPAVEFSTSVTADSNGSFVYAYQLDGNYRLNYKVEIKNTLGVVVTSITFTDSPAPGCYSDAQGANDQPGQKDVTRACANYAGLPTSIAISWNWDEISGSGNNSYDACSLYDTDNDGFANYAVCVTSKGDPLAQDASSPRIYTCTDSKPDRCAGATLVPGPYSTSCSVSQQNTDPFPTGDVSPQDSVASCTVVVSEVGGATSNLLDGCSFPSQQPNSDPSDCIFASTASQTGKLEVVKSLAPSNDSGKFNLQIDGTSFATDIGNSGTTGEKILTAGNHTVAETAGTGTTLANYTPTLECFNDVDHSNTVNAGDTAHTVNTSTGVVAVGNNDDIICRFTNTRNQGTIELRKVWSGTGGQTTLNIGTSAGASNIDTQLTGAVGATPLTTGANTVDIGTYYVSETGGLDNYGSSLACTDNGQSVTPGAGNSLSVATGHAIICTFTNTRQAGKIELQKDFIGTPESVTIKIGTAQNGSQVDTDTLLADGTDGEHTVDTGNYFVSETLTTPTNYASSLECFNDVDHSNTINAGDTTHTVNAGTGAVAVGNNDDVICRFTNTRNQGTIELEKTWSGTGGQTTLNIGTSAGGTQTVSQQTGVSGAAPLTTGAQTVNTGTYYVSETGSLTDYSSSLACTDNGQPVTPGTDNSLSVATGHAIICTFTNTRNQGTIELKKVWSGTAGQTTLNIGTFSSGSQVDTQLTGAAGAAPLTTGQNAVDTGTYYISETGGLTNYTLSASCFNDANNNGVNDNESTVPTGSHDSVIIAAGEHVVCAYTNTRDTGTLQILKNVDLNGDSDYTDANETGATNWVWQANGGSNHNTGDSAITVDTGDYALTETSQTNFHFVSLNCTGGTLNGSTVTVAKNATVVCTFTNARDIGAIVVNKLVDTNSDGSFETSNTGANTLGFRWGLDSVTPARNMGTSAINVSTGTHSVDENSVTNYHLVGWYRNGGEGSCSNLDSSSLPASIDVYTDTTTTITLCNARNTGTIQVVKDVVPNDSGATGWDFSISGPTANGVNNLVDGGSSNAFTSMTGSYAVAETAHTGTTASNYNTTYSCSDNTGVLVFGSGTTTSSFSLATGKNVVCTFTNTIKNGTIIVQKNMVGGTADFAFTGGVAGTISVSGGQLTTSNLLPGTYTSTESAKIGWDLNSITCNDTTNGGVASSGNTSTRTATFNLDPGETITCTFTNTELGNVTVVKYNDHNGNGIKDVGDEALGDTGIGAEIEATRWEIHLVGTGVNSYQWTGAQVAGQVTFSDLLPNSFTLSEQFKAGWDQTNIACGNEEGIDDDNSHPIELAAGQDITCYVGNRGQGTIIVEKDVVPDSDATFNFSIEGSLIETIGFVLGDGDSTDPDYSGLPAGTYSVSETPNELYTTDVQCVSSDEDTEVANALNLDPGETITCSYTNTRKTGTIIVHKIIDPDGNLEDDTDQFPGENWEMDADGFGDASDFFSQFTGADGTTTFSPANTGNYNVREINANEDGYDLVDYYCDNGVADDNIVFTSVGADETVNCTFINSPNGTIHGQKWNDVDGNGVRNGEEEYLAGWKIFLDENDNGTWDEGEEFKLTQEGVEFGWYSFDHLFPGTYSICEVTQAGWTQTSSPTCHTVELFPRGQNTCTLPEEQNSTFGPTCNFGNQEQDPILTLTKTNDTGGADKHPGDSVIFTLTVSATQSAVNEVTVTDLPASGFRYRAGSCTATSTVRGTIPCAPTYASPGVWGLGNMIVGEVVTLTYIADIDGSQQPGLYPDVAWAEGKSLSNLGVLANADTGVFVGTTVNVVTSPGGVAYNGESRVLGASTSLPATGSEPIWLILGFVTLLVGFFMIRKGDKRKHA